MRFVVLLVALACLLPVAQAGFALRTYEWSPASVAACGDAATGCFDVTGLVGVRVHVFAQDHALGPQHHDVRVDVALLDASGNVVSALGSWCDTASVTIPSGAATLRAHVVPPTAEDVAAGTCGMPMRGQIVMFW